MILEATNFNIMQVYGICLQQSVPSLSSGNFSLITEKVVSLFSCGLFKTFVEEVMELVELNPLRDSRLGLPGSTGLPTKQRKRLTIADELVANPSIIFMDEPTSGLDARAAAIVMRTVRNTLDTGRTVNCTIHEPSINFFEAFHEVMKPVYLALRSVIVMLIRDLVFVCTLSILERICSPHRPF